MLCFLKVCSAIYGRKLHRKKIVCGKVFFCLNLLVFQKTKENILNTHEKTTTTTKKNWIPNQTAQQFGQQFHQTAEHLFPNKYDVFVFWVKNDVVLVCFCFMYFVMLSYLVKKKTKKTTSITDWHQHRGNEAVEILQSNCF